MPSLNCATSSRPRRPFFGEARVMGIRVNSAADPGASPTGGKKTPRAKRRLGPTGGVFTVVFFNGARVAARP
jgi:hypothetical protein